MSALGLIVAAPQSGSGKTLMTMALLRALRRRGLRVAAAKSGPDYIDPGFHAVASGRPCLNLDAWAMRPATIAATVASLARDADLVLCEGAMGLFDGIDAVGTGSCADLAHLTGWPVALVVDCAAQAASVAALVAGFVHHRHDVEVAGVIFNNVGSARHAALLDESVAQSLPHLARLGALARDPALALPERHLGLVQAREQPALEPLIDRAADRVEQAIALDALVALARPTQLLPSDVASPLPPLGQRIAVARDHAFSFAYPATLDGWHRAGAEMMPFSPLRDEAPDASADAVFLPGGYPELHAGRLAANQKFLDGLRGLARRGAVVYGECGGYMALGRVLVDADGVGHVMAGLLPVETSFQQRRLSLGYRTVKLAGAGPLGSAGTGFRGHEFHYATTMTQGDFPLFEARDGAGTRLPPTGSRNGTVMGSFIHLIDHHGVAPA
ncbi:MAG TPA: cobyrinate a,c-diamide synthase [Alphaproteobacteria bacterium]|nr:cobyrinate a,c-diamide synthase [Alphaproteobacteria bacterium]